MYSYKGSSLLTFIVKIIVVKIRSGVCRHTLVLTNINNLSLAITMPAAGVRVLYGSVVGLAGYLHVIVYVLKSMAQYWHSSAIWTDSVSKAGCRSYT